MTEGECLSFQYTNLIPLKGIWQMLRVTQFRHNHDNLSYLVYGEKDAIAIDGGASKEILHFIKNRKLNLLFVTNTHGHPDHTSGNRSLLKGSKATFIGYDVLVNRGVIEVEGHEIKVINTPGHTNDSVCFYFNNILLAGDTLFNGTVGNCFSGSLENFYHSVKKIMALPKDTIIYAGHDYIKDALSFAKKLEPDNEYSEILLHNYNPDHPVSTLKSEFEVNPYLRVNERSIVELLKKNDLPRNTELQRWISLMSIE
jgi:hydroxyacylglutathione hydrolase